MAYPHSQEIWGWMPFAGRHRLELPSGPIAVIARYQGNPRRSNWAGKTAWLESFDWCFFGVHRKRHDDGVINKSCDECGVDVDLGILRARRVKKRGAAEVFELWLPDGTHLRGDAAQKEMFKILAVSLADYNMTVCFKQDDIEAIVGQTSGKRRQVIAGWLRLEKWALAAKRAGEKASAAQKKLVELRAAVQTAGEAVLPPGHEETLEGVIRTKSTEADELRRQRVELGAAAHVDVDQLTADFDEMDELRIECEQLKKQLAGRKEADEAAAQAAIVFGDAATAARDANERVAELKAIVDEGFDGACPVTCSACPVAEQVQQVVTDSSVLLTDALVLSTKKTAEHTRAMRANQEAQQKARGYLTLVERFNQKVARGVELKEKLKPYTRASLLQIGADQDQLQHQDDELSHDIEDRVRQIAELQQQVNASKEARERLARKQTELEVAEREARITAKMVQALGPAGVPTRIARKQVGQLEASSNELLHTQGLSIEFAWERPTKELAPMCPECGFMFTGQRDKACPHCSTARGPKMSDELEILVDDGSDEVEDVKAKSGGAKVLVASALRFSAIAMLRALRGTPVAWATIDEPFGPLDSENRDALARTFTGMLSSVGLEQAFVVSHDAALLDAMPSRIVIEREGKVSTLRVER